MSEKDPCTTDVSDKEKMSNRKNDEEILNQKDDEKMSTQKDDEKMSNEEAIDTKMDKNEKSSINVDNTVKPTTTSPTSKTEPKKDRRIPDWLPEKNNVAVVEPINKPPHLRSKVSLH